MKTKPYSRLLLSLLLLLLGITNCAADDNLDAVERNIEGQRDKLPHGGKYLPGMLTDIEFDREQRTVRYFFINN